MDQTLPCAGQSSYEDQLELLALKRLPPENRGEILNHLTVCEVCRLTLADLREYVSQWEAARKGEMH